MNRKPFPLTALLLSLALSLTCGAQVTNVSPVTNVTHVVTNPVTFTVTEIQVPITLSSLRFVVANEFVMGANIATDQLLLDVPGSSRKMWSYTLDPTAWYVVEVKVTLEGGILQTKRFQPETRLTDLSPNLPRNQYSGDYDSYRVFLVPTPSVPPRPPGDGTTPAALGAGAYRAK